MEKLHNYELFEDQPTTTENPEKPENQSGTEVGNTDTRATERSTHIKDDVSTRRRSRQAVTSDRKTEHPYQRLVQVQKKKDNTNTGEK